MLELGFRTTVRTQIIISVMFSARVRVRVSD